MTEVSSLLEPLYDSDHRAYRESVATFLEREVVPVHEEWEGSAPRDLLRGAAEHGFLGMQIPEEHGGAGVDDLRFAVVVGEEAMRARASSLALVMTAHTDVAVPALLRGDASAEWLSGLASGDLLATVVRGGVQLGDGEAEGGAGGDVAIRGTCPFVAGGADANLLVVASESAVAVIEAGAPGVAVSASDPSIGLLSAGLADIAFDGATGVAIGGTDAARELAIDQALSLAVTALGGARSALAITVEYVLDRKAFGRPLAEFQNTEQFLGAVGADVDAAAALVDLRIRERLAGSLDLPAAAGAKLHCTELFARAVDSGVQLHGGYGYIMEYPIAHAYADARFWRLYGGTSEEMRQVVARALFQR